MKRNFVILSSLCWSCVDLIICTLIYGHWKYVNAEFKTVFDFNESLFDLWVIGALRFSFLVGLAIAVLRNTQNSVERLNTFSPFAPAIPITWCSYATIKLLVLSDEEVHLKDVWFWTQLTWCILGSIGYHIQYVIFRNIAVNSDQTSLEPLESNHVSINDSESNHVAINDSESGVCDNTDERTPLLSASGTNSKKAKKKLDKTSEDEPKGKPPGKGIILRLLSYSKPDIGLILVAVLFLLIAALGTYFLNINPL